MQARYFINLEVIMYLAENLKSLRKEKNWTQEEMAEFIGVSPQSVSKWERGDTYPDITLLPSLANLFKVSIDALVGMNRINDEEARNLIFKTGQEHLTNGDDASAIDVYTNALKIFPNDYGMMSELALVLSLEDDYAKLKQAVELCERVINGDQTEKVRHTTRTARCFIHYKLGENDKAIIAAKNLPHARESREHVMAVIQNQPDIREINAYLKLIMLDAR